MEVTSSSLVLSLYIKYYFLMGQKTNAIGLRLGNRRMWNFLYCSDTRELSSNLVELSQLSYYVKVMLNFLGYQPDITLSQKFAGKTSVFGEVFCSAKDFAKLGAVERKSASMLSNVKWRRLMKSFWSKQFHRRLSLQRRKQGKIYLSPFWGASKFEIITRSSAKVHSHRVPLLSSKRPNFLKNFLLNVTHNQTELLNLLARDIPHKKLPHGSSGKFRRQVLHEKFSHISYRRFQKQVFYKKLPYNSDRIFCKSFWTKNYQNRLNLLKSFHKRSFFQNFSRTKRYGLNSLRFSRKIRSRLNLFHRKMLKPLRRKLPSRKFWNIVADKMNPTSLRVIRMPSFGTYQYILSYLIRSWSKLCFKKKLNFFLNYTLKEWKHYLRKKVFFPSIFVRKLRIWRTKTDVSFRDKTLQVYSEVPSISTFVSAGLIADFIGLQLAMPQKLKTWGFKRSLKIGLSHLIQHSLKGSELSLISGIKILCSGRWSKTKSGRSQQFAFCLGKVGTQTFSSFSDFGSATATTKYGVCCVKVWITHRKVSIT